MHVEGKFFGEVKLARMELDCYGFLSESHNMWNYPEIDFGNGDKNVVGKVLSLSSLLELKTAQLQLS